MIQLNFYPWESWAEYRDVIVQAKKETGITEQLKPTAAQAGCGKAIAVQPIPFLCDHALVRSQNVAAFVHALLWYVSDDSNDSRYTSAAKQLTQWLGGPVEEIDNISEH